LLHHYGPDFSFPAISPRGNLTVVTFTYTFPERISFTSDIHIRYKVRMNTKMNLPPENIVLVESIMSGKMTKINADMSALEVAKKMSENKVSSIILTGDQDKVEGIVTERDLVRNICANDVLASKISQLLRAYPLL
jgi:signal-transduction protein with cAMP-binding, CBS, and nucleotidyltransferase domain